MKIRPFYDKVLIKRVDSETMTRGGLYIPDTAKEKPMYGEVLAVGRGRVLKDGTVRPIAVKEGDRIVFSKYAGTEFKIEGDEHLLVREDDILGVMDKE